MIGPLVTGLIAAALTAVLFTVLGGGKPLPATLAPLVLVAIVFAFFVGGVFFGEEAES